MSTGIEAMVVTRPEIMAATKCNFMPSSMPMLFFAVSLAWE